MRCTSAVSRRLTRSGELLFDKEMKTWVSSAYCCKVNLELTGDELNGGNEGSEQIWVQEPNLEERQF